ncbi:hypothetical protein AV530_019059 [Patagioenas fasciata monilis]|uniref:Uncharacterized protein n=1 Tax=Patagioenas fasciata monilis TaxID=372326 RepID=A0A1V4KY70_PATFA|nr:hypothetical protein AV530_019059 [Patagioenas fasciata monilis]
MNVPVCPLSTKPFEYHQGTWCARAGKSTRDDKRALKIDGLLTCAPSATDKTGGGNLEAVTPLWINFQSRICADGAFQLEYKACKRNSLYSVKQHRKKQRAQRRQPRVWRCVQAPSGAQIRRDGFVLRAEITVYLHPPDPLVLRWLRLLRGASGFVSQRSTRGANELLFLYSRPLKRRLQMNVVAELVWSHQSQFLLKPAAGEGAGDAESRRGHNSSRTGV